MKSIIEQADQDGDGKISYSEFLLAMSCDTMGKTSRKSSGQYSDEGKSIREGLGLGRNSSFVQNVRAGLVGLSRLGSAARITSDDLVQNYYDSKLGGSIENV